MKKSFLLLFFALIIFSGCSRSFFNVNDGFDNNLNDFYVLIKYRDDKVNLNNGLFEYLDTSESSWVEGAWYDSDNEYMVINLNGVYYHYCEMPDSAWSRFELSESFGSDYNEYIKGNYDCRLGYVPSYK